MKKAIIILAIVAALGISGYVFYKKQIDKLMDMDYEFMGFQLHNLSVSKSIADVKIKLISDSTLEAEILDLYLDVYINGKFVGVVSENKKILIPAKGYSIVDFHIAADLSKVGENALDLAGQIWANKDATIQLKGTAKVKSSFITVRVPIDYSESIKYLLS